jgi:hypothetical protein
VTAAGELNDTVKGLREWGARQADFWKDPPRGECQAPAGCTEENPILFESHDADGLLLCADHYRRASDVEAHKSYPCDRCGAGGAFRDPAHRRDEMLCQSCHKDDGYEPTERAMVNKTAARVGAEHPMARRVKCIAAGKGTACKGEIKQRGKVGVLCTFHFDPVKYNKAKSS